jgi:hypothetical protein
MVQAPVGVPNRFCTNRHTRPLSDGPLPCHVHSAYLLAPMSPWWLVIFALVFLIGVTKSGFGSGVGLMIVPMTGWLGW